MDRPSGWDERRVSVQFERVALVLGEYILVSRVTHESLEAVVLCRSLKLRFESKWMRF